jgi:hypothetical protein
VKNKERKENFEIENKFNLPELRRPKETRRFAMSLMMRKRKSF